MRAIEESLKNPRIREMLRKEQRGNDLEDRILEIQRRQIADKMETLNLSDAIKKVLVPK
ncbi:hypothetical protein LCGC14_3151520 [marine sediment metagenome]|uniref:Uncharacterized protein n=1 Tax=marine sediment metagenome TaxID=412755 RepID=A0A0F8VTZ7_9ZZZZ